MREIAERLLEKTRANEARWKFHETDDFGCELVLPTSSIELLPEAARGGPEGIRMIVNRLSDDVGAMPVSEWFVREGEADWELLHDLYDLASKRVYGWDTVLQEVENAVRGKGPIGSDED